MNPVFSIILPCYNEKENLPVLINRLLPLQKQYNMEYILVENGSKDGSLEYFKRNIENLPGITAAYVSENRGYGYGLQQGMKAASGDYIGWLHADLQIPPESLIPFFDFILENHKSSESQERQKESEARFTRKQFFFLKGRRHGRSLKDNFFTAGQAVFTSLLFRRRLNDIGAIPVLFSRDMIADIKTDSMPNDFSIELYVYLAALRKNAIIKRFDVIPGNRKLGKSSWDGNIKAKIKQSFRIFKDTIKIFKGEKVS